MHCGKHGCKGAHDLIVASRYSRSVEGAAGLTLSDS